MAAAAYNMRHWMNNNALTSFVSWLLALVGRHENVIFGNNNKSAAGAQLSQRSRRGALAGLTK